MQMVIAKQSSKQRCDAEQRSLITLGVESPRNARTAVRDKPAGLYKHWAAVVLAPYKVSVLSPLLAFSNY